MASGARLDVSDAEAPIVASICRKLDGVALAIELAARRVESYGLQQTAALLDQRLTLLWLGSRTAPPRQKTLQATLDWSFGLLTEPERVVLRRLAVFVGHFTLDAALEVVTSATLDRSTVLSAIDSLVAKSIVATSPVGAMMRYRLLDTTRAYVLESNIDDAESADLAVRHAAYYRRWLEQAGTEWSGLGDRRGTNSPLCCRQQCSGRFGMVLWRQRKYRHRHRTCRPLPRQSSWRCLCFRNVIVGPNARSSLSMTPHVADSTRCIFKRRSACRRCSPGDATSRAMPPWKEVCDRGEISRCTESDSAPQPAQHVSSAGRQFRNWILNTPKKRGLSQLGQWTIQSRFRGRHRCSDSPFIFGRPRRRRVRPGGSARVHRVIRQSLADFLVSKQTPGESSWQELCGCWAIRIRRLIGLVRPSRRLAPRLVVDLAIASIWAISVFRWTGDLQSAVEYIDRLISRTPNAFADPLPVVGLRSQE